MALKLLLRLSLFDGVDAVAPVAATPATSSVTISGALNEAGATFSITLSASDGPETFTHTALAGDTGADIAAGIAALTAASDYSGPYSITDDGTGELTVSRADGVNFSIGEGVVANHTEAATAESDAVVASTDGSEAVVYVPVSVGDTQYATYSVFQAAKGLADDAVANFFAPGGQGADFGSLDDAGDATSLSNEISRVTGLRDDFDVLEADAAELGSALSQVDTIDVAAQLVGGPEDYTSRSALRDDSVDATADAQALSTALQSAEVETIATTVPLTDGGHPVSSYATLVAEAAAASDAVADFFAPAVPADDISGGPGSAFAGVVDAQGDPVDPEAALLQTISDLRIQESNAEGYETDVSEATTALGNFLSATNTTFGTSYADSDDIGDEIQDLIRF